MPVVPYFSEIKYRGHAQDDFAEVVVEEGADVSNIQVVVYHTNGNVRSTNNLGALDSTEFGRDVYTVNAGIHKDGAIALVENGVVISFVSFDSVVSPTTGPAAGMTSTQIGSTGNNQNQSLMSTDGGGNYSAGPITEGTIPCFLRGTLIATKRGEVAVENLVVGDHIVVRDAGYAELKWIGSVIVDARGRHADENAPIRIPAGAMGRNKPARDLYVSPNHRIWLSDPSYEMFFEDQEVLIPAKHLVGWKGIEQVRYVPTPEYFHVLLDRHHIVISDGLLTESYFPSDATAQNFAKDTQSELYRLFPELKNIVASGQTARRCLRRFEVELALDAKDVA